MKYSLQKDTIREIKNTYKRFLSILLIVLLGVGFFVGIKAASPDMKRTLDQYYKDQNVMDLEVISTLGITQNDIIALKEIEEIEEVMPSYSFDAIVSTQEKDIVTKMISFPEEVNHIVLIEGRLPEAENECVVEKGFLISTGYKIGDHITADPEEINTEEESEPILKQKELIIVGTVESPLYVSKGRGSTKLGSGTIDYYMYINKQNINLEYYTEVYLTIKNANQLLCYDKKYEKLTDEIQDKIKEVAKVREKARYDEIIDEMTQKINDAQTTFNEEKEKAEKELNDAQDQLDDAKQTIETSKKEISTNESKAKKQFAQAEQKLEAAEKELNEQEPILKQKKQEFQTQKKEAEKSLQQINLGIIELETQKEQMQQTGIDTTKIEENIQKLKTQKETIQSQIKEGTNQIQEAESKLATGKKEIQSQKLALSQTKQKTEKQLQTAKNQIVQGEEEIQENEVKLEDARKEASKKLTEAQEKLDDANEQIAKIEEPQWYILNRKMNQGYVEYMQDSDKIANIAKVFPVVFFIVAALISLTSMARMVEEERVQIGTLKALGYEKHQIAGKYIMYALLATVFGSGIGMIIGFQILPRIIFHIYGMMYTLPEVICEFNVSYALLGLFAALLCTCGATIYTVWKDLRVTPASLMIPKAPKPGKRIFLEKLGFIWSRMKFTQKVTARNLFRYKKRFLMTIIGVCGCTALILSGFGLRDAVGDMIPSQYGQIFQYDITISLKDNLSEEQIKKEKEIIEQQEGVIKTKSFYVKTIEIGNVENGQDIQLMVPENNEDLSDFIKLQSRTKKNEKYTLTNDAIIITEKIARVLGIKVGDNIIIKNSDDIEKEVTIGAITENYLLHYIYMSNELYTSLYGQNITQNVILAKTQEMTDEQEEKMGNNVLKENHVVSSVNFSSNTKSIFSDIMENMELVVWVLIISAGLLAFAVLYNLSNVNISERIRELATIKVLGFYDKEVYQYLNKETVLLTAIGIIAGLVGGVLLTMFIIKTCELDMLMFNQKIHLLSYIYAIAITVFFATVVNIATYLALKKIDMIESLKSIE